MKNAKIKKPASPMLLVLLSFVIVILLGSFLLVLPFANKDGNRGPYIDALFTAVSATCVTGLSTLPNGIGNDLTLFGQIVVLLLIEIGGLGFITIFAFIVTLFQKKLRFKDRYTLTQAVGATNMSQLRRFVRNVILICLTMQVIGTLLYIPAFMTVLDNPYYIVWYSIFHATSMFNNAGFDLLGTTSFIKDVTPLLQNMPEWAYVYLRIVTMVLIVIGSTSFIAIMDILFKRKIKLWSAFTKIVLIMNATLLLFGFLGFLAMEGFDAEHPMSVLDCLFQSVTLRTAGAATFDQSQLSLPGMVLSCVLMFIGGSPLSTAGGIKTTTIFIIVLSIWCYFRGKRVVAFKRYFHPKNVIRAMSLVFIAVISLVVAIALVSAFEHGNEQTSDRSFIVFECFSAFGTVGVSAGITPYLTIGSKIVLCLLMFIGRLGPISFFQVIDNRLGREDDRNFKFVEEEILIG